MQLCALLDHRYSHLSMIGCTVYVDDHTCVPLRGQASWGVSCWEAWLLNPESACIIVDLPS